MIASGKELQDAQQMGFYRLQEDACLHVMISGGSRGSATRPAGDAKPTTQKKERKQPS